MTESYLSLRRLENKALKARLGQNIAFGFEEADLTPIKVSIQQFYGIEINDFAVSVAKTALWIAEAQMFEETQTSKAKTNGNEHLQNFDVLVDVFRRTSRNPAMIGHWHELTDDFIKNL